MCWGKGYICTTIMKWSKCKHIVCMLVVMLMVSSCGDQYNILGTSSVDVYEGSTVYLKIESRAGLCAYDSAEVSHGKFGFEGNMDTICMAHLFVGDHSLLPLVLETGNISISFTDADRNVRGGNLNNKLYRFLSENSRLQNEIQMASRNTAKLILAGATPESYADMEKRGEILQDKLDRLWVSFIVNNSDNVLGPVYFQEYTSQYFYPVITPQIERILKRASQSFLCNPSVQMYIRDARYNMMLIQGNFPR